MKYYVVDAFTDRLFGGNPAGVCLLDAPLSDEVLQNIAFENNLSETALVLGKDGDYDLRWFTPSVEIDLCGHATLASASVLSMHQADTERFVFHTKSGKLSVTRSGDDYFLDFPSRPPVVCEKPAVLEEALGVHVIETYIARDMLVVLESEETVRQLKPNLELIKKINAFGIIVTAKGESVDFVSRFFAPGAGIDEDPVTGSSHCTLIPYWSEKLGKTEMNAAQLSQRGGTLRCIDDGERVKIGGNAVLYMEGDIRL